MTRSCTKCGAPLPLQVGRGRPRSKCATCSPSRAKVRQPVTVDLPTTGRGLTDATRATLVAAGLADSPEAHMALRLAERIEADSDSGASLAALVKQLRETLTAALASAQDRAADPLDELAAKRERRRA